MKKKTSIRLDHVTKKSCDTVQQKWKQVGWVPQIHNHNFLSQALVSPWSHFLYTITKPPNMLKTTPNVVDLAMDLLLSTQARKHRESTYHQFKTTNLRQHNSHQEKS